MAFHDGIMEFRTPAKTVDPAIDSEPAGRPKSLLLDQAFTRAAGAIAALLLQKITRCLGRSHRAFTRSD